MQLTCPNCSHPVRAENINIQEMAAVCSNCNTIFQFNTPEAKAKRRKVKQPYSLAVKDAETLQMQFRTNWRLGSNEQFVGFSIGGIMMSFVSILLINEFFAGDVPLLLPLMMALVAIGLLYFAGLEAYNHTAIEMDNEKITVQRRPLPNLFKPKQVVTLQGVESIQCEETPKSIKEGYDLPRFRIWVETASGVRRMIVNDVTEEYAYFIAQRLEEKLFQDTDIDASHLIDVTDDNNQIVSEIEQAQAQQKSQ